MAIVFDGEGGFREIPDPVKPKKKYFSYPISGPSRTELFNALKLYPKRKVTFDISIPSIQDCPFELLPPICCEIFVSGIRVLLSPMNPGDKVTIDRIEDYWSGEGFVKTKNGFRIISFSYDTKKRQGTLYFSIVE